MRDEYLKRLEARQQAAGRHLRLAHSIGNYRLLVVIAGIAAGWYNIWLAPIAVACFVALLVWHEKVLRNGEAEKRAAAFYQRGLERLEGRWAGHGESGERFRDPAHPYADDLDVFGNGSLFQLISSARTAAGEAMLATWLKGAAAPPVVRARQEAVRELAPRLDLREQLALQGEEARAEVHTEALLKWGSAPHVPVPGFARLVAAIFMIVSVIAFSGYMLQQWTWHVPVIALLVQSMFAFWLRDRVLHIIEASEMPGRDLRLVALILARFEQEQFQSQRLLELAKALETGGQPASKQIARLHWLIQTHDWARNQMFAPVAKALLWSTQFALAIEAWRQRSGPAISRWLEAIAELESLSSLSGHAAENPSDVFPDLVNEGPLFDAGGLTHPLLPSDAGIRNDVCLDPQHRLLLVSGSNMSGKSTLMRSIGLNTVLAWAGAPVRATRLRISPLAVGASMRIQDSILDGKSRFYAEITRLRQIVEMSSGPIPLLFLLDELLSGTNSHDRRIGAHAVVKMLVERGAIGLVSTHDLALTGIVEEVHPHATNVHFEDHLENGRIAFDYKLRSGVVEKSNAIELMRSVGLEV